MEQEQIHTLPEMWAVVDLFGHQRIAGKLTTQTLGAACLLRIDVPECTRTRQKYNSAQHSYEAIDEAVPAFTRFLGVGAIYAINPCSEQTVRALLKRLDAAPIQEYEIDRVKALPAAVQDAEYPDPEDVPTEGVDEEESGEGDAKREDATGVPF